MHRGLHLLAFSLSSEGSFIDHLHHRLSWAILKVTKGHYVSFMVYEYKESKKSKRKLLTGILFP
jgi:hypothetical protein